VAKVGTHWCCECDYCKVSSCDGTPAHCIFLTDWGEHFNYYQFCNTHKPDAEQDITTYLAAHPDVAVDKSDGAGSVEETLAMWPDFAEVRSG
jgi:hypothetical protein